MASLKDTPEHADGNTPKFKKILKHLLNDGHIFLIVLLGIGGMFFYTSFFFSHLKTTKFKKEYWLVKDTLVRGNTRTAADTVITTEDTLKVVYHPLISAHIDSSANDRERALKSHEKLENTNGKSTINYKQLYFTYNSVFMVWIAFGAIGFGFALASLPVLLMSIRNLILQFKIRWWTLGFITFFSAVIGWLMYHSDKIDYFMGTITIVRQFGILVSEPDSLHYFVVAGVVAGLFGFAGQMLVNTSINKLPDTIAFLDEMEQKDVRKKFLLLRNQLKLFLIINSVSIVLSVLTVDAFRRAIIADIQVNLDILPQNFVYLYGLIFTSCLAVIYVPIYSRLKLKGEQMLDDVSQADQEGNLKSITATLRIQQTPIESLQVILSILAPVLTSLVPGLLKI
jgi:hypothetical protein